MERVTKKELAAEVERLRSFVKRINELSSNAIGDEEEVSDAVVEHLEGELNRLRELVFIDELTGLFNRRGFYDRATLFFKEAYNERKAEANKRARQIGDYTALFFDADNFKAINDAYGHEAGDAVLIGLGRTLMKNVRHGDVVARFGGEEFVVGLLGVGEDFGIKKAESIRKAIQTSVHVPGNENHPVTVSVGVASLGASDADELDELVAYADQAMYEAKTHRGKNNSVRFSELPK